MTVKDNTQLIEIMTLLIKIQVRSCTEGILAIEPMVKKVRDPFLKKGLMDLMKVTISGFSIVPELSLSKVAKTSSKASWENSSPDPRFPRVS